MAGGGTGRRGREPKRPVSTSAEEKRTLRFAADYVHALQPETSFNRLYARDD
jgi:hypothetical protein